MQLAGLCYTLHNAGISVLYQDREMQTVWARNMRALWLRQRRQQWQHCRWLSGSYGAAKRNVASGNPERLNLRSSRRYARWFQVWIDADHGDGGIGTGRRHDHG
jgi:hypothetical protein